EGKQSRRLHPRLPAAERKRRRYEWQRRRTEGGMTFLSRPRLSPGQAPLEKADLPGPTTRRFTPHPAPATFDEAFREIGRKKRGGGPKTTGADELLFCGDLGSGCIYLRSRVRLMDPNESFYTCSNHRLRDSHAGSGGHWVDIEVLGTCTDD